jgi:protein PsiE
MEGQAMSKPAFPLARQALVVVEMAGLIVIGIATVIALGQEVLNMIGERRVSLADLLLLFIYLEVLTMVGLYLTSGQLPVRMPLYIGMVALARYLMLDMKEMDAWRMLAVAGAVLLLAAAVLLIRYGHVRFPYEREDEPEARPRKR